VGTTSNLFVSDTALASPSRSVLLTDTRALLLIPTTAAGPKVAAILSVVESCRRLGVPVKDYFTAVLPD
jgi:transposase